MPSVPFSLILTAAGASRRFSSDTKKEFSDLDGHSVLYRAAEPFFRPGGLQIAVVTYAPGQERSTRLAMGDLADRGVPVYFTPGGGTRQASVKNALEFLSGLGIGGLVLIHDGARPFVSVPVIGNVINAAMKTGAASAAVPVADSVVRSDGQLFGQYVDRSGLFCVQTPQAFDFQSILRAHRLASEEGRSFSDDISVYQTYIGPAAIAAGDRGNIKITWQDDLRSNGGTFRTGYGWDLHALSAGRPLMIGGVMIPSDKGEVAHSDGDVLIHAIIDAILGALALGDIGQHFPDTDPAYSGADSADLLRRTLKLAGRPEIINLDCTVILEKPKLAPFIIPIRARLASIMGLDASRVSVKAKTAEHLGAIGCGEAVSALACVLISR